MNEKIISFRGLFDLDQLEEDIAEAEHQMADPTFGMTQKKLNKSLTQTMPTKRPTISSIS